MEDKKIAQRILDYVGGAENIESAAHCATRLRLVIKDQGIVDKDGIEKLEDVKGTFTTAGQFQIILGTGLVNRVFAEMVKIGNINQATTGEVTRTAMKHLNPVQRLARVLSNIMVPIIPAIVASGLLMGLLGYLEHMKIVDDKAGIIKLLDMFANIAFIYLPILIAYSAGREFGANPVLAAALGGFMVHPALQNAWTQGSAKDALPPITLMGHDFAALGYQGTVLPILLAVFVMAYVERGIRRVVPNILDILITPFATLLISGMATFCVIGPAMRFVGQEISFGLTWMLANGGPLAGLIFGGIYSAIVITGVHHSFHAIEAEMINNTVERANYLLPIWSMSNVAQGGAAAAMFFKTQNAKIKAIALPAAFSCLLGITEAAIFGVNLKLYRPFFCALGGGAAGGAWVVFNKVAMSSIGLTGLPGMSIVFPDKLISYIIGMVVAFGVAFALTIVIPVPEEEADA